MKKSILLTCFGGNVFYEFSLDFQQRGDLEIFISDLNPSVKARTLTKNFIQVLPVTNSHFALDLLQKAKSADIRMIIPGADEEALALMRHREQFEREGIIVAVQDIQWLPIFESKTNLYDDLKRKGFPVPRYQRFKTTEEFERALKHFGYPNQPVLIKPNAARGGRGITILSERLVPNKDNLALFDKQLFRNLMDGTTEFLMMEYIDGVVYDIDALTYKNGKQYFGIRKRFNNVTKLFSGNIFEKNPKILAFVQRLYQILPTKYLIDYDLMVTEAGEITLLEVNPRPSGSTVSFLPFGINLYYTLVKSYLDNEHIPIHEPAEGEQAVAFYKMVKGSLL